MAKGPAVVIVARHGARLDAADKSWHLTSPTPYDPPLTYGGWTQGKALGLRIAALLHQRDNEQARAQRNAPIEDLAHPEFSNLDTYRSFKIKTNDGKRPQKKRKIIIHSSPYIRCVQTSTAVAAGLAQYQLPGTPNLKVPNPLNHRNGSRSTSPLTRPPPTKSPLSRPIPLQPIADPALEVFSKPHERRDKLLLRIDAFLGEWLSPDYFEDITPPPNSTMMVAGAKADLLRRGDLIQEMPKTDSSKGHFPGGWTKGGSPGNNRVGVGGEKSQSGDSLVQVPLLRERASSHGRSLSLQRTQSREGVISSPTQQSSRTYAAPVPSYSVSTADPIPRGYVAHAQDTCIQVDFQWDSMRPPQDWGDGGEYGDEWSTMHKRFRKGLTGMMDWYREHGTAPPKEKTSGFMVKVLSNRPVERLSPAFDEGAEEVDDEELVLILVTHGAGCNALLGAMTNQPVLIDVGLASLSMAVLRTEPRKASVPTIFDRRLSVADPGMANTYEVKLLASTDHLRAGVDPTKTLQQSQISSPIINSSPSLDHQRRFTGFGATNSQVEAPLNSGEPSRNWNSALGSVRRTSSSGFTSRYLQTLANSGDTASPSFGLWSGSRTPVGDNSSDGRSSPGGDMMLNFSVQHPKSSTNKTTAPPNNSTPAADLVPEATSGIGLGLSKFSFSEDKETSDKATPLNRTFRHPSVTTSPGLWGAKPAAKSSVGLWGPPKLDDVYEHGRGPKRRWTVTEREDAAL